MLSPRPGGGRINNPPGIRTNSPVSVARFSSGSVIASGLEKLLFKSESAACRSASPNELMISCVPGVAVGDGDGAAVDFGAGLFAGGAPDGAGVWPSKFAANKNEMAIAAARLNIAVNS